MSSVEIANRSDQDVSVALVREGRRDTANIPKKCVIFFLDAEPTPELEALHRNKHMNVTYRVIQD